MKQQRVTMAAIWAEALSECRRNRKGLRQRGLTGEDITFLELWLAMPRASYAALGRIRGYSRQCARTRALRLQELGAVVLVGGRLVPNARGLLRWAVAACQRRLHHVVAKARARSLAAFERRNALASFAKKRIVSGCTSHKGTSDLESRETGQNPVRALKVTVNGAIEARWLAEMGLL